MANLNITATTTETIRGAATVDSMMSELWNRTADRLTEEELKWFAGSSSYATMQARNLSEVVEGVGCLIGSDKDAGNFRHPSDLSTLLFTVAHSVDTIAGMMEISDEAQHRLANPEYYKALREAMARSV